jgi:hypothetical protein
LAPSAASDAAADTDAIPPPPLPPSLLDAHNDALHRSALAAPLGPAGHSSNALDEFLSSAARPPAGALTPGSGEFAFTLHDTYGFPVDLTQKVMEERGHALDEAGFESAMEAQRTRARASMATADAVFTASIAVKLRDAGCSASQTARALPLAFTAFMRLA